MGSLSSHFGLPCLDTHFKVSKIGGGSHAFIPDAGFVGTVFVNAMSNLLVTAAINTTLTLEPVNGASFPAGSVSGGHPSKVQGAALSVDLASVQFGQARQLLLKMTVPRDVQEFLRVSLHCRIRDGTFDSESRGTLCDAGSMELEVQRCRVGLVDAVQRAGMTSVSVGHVIHWNWLNIAWCM